MRKNSANTYYQPKSQQAYKISILFHTLIGSMSVKEEYFLRKKIIFTAFHLLTAFLPILILIFFTTY